jgi:hypothetical protein
MHNDPAPAYEPPSLGDAVGVVAATLFSVTINPDAGVIEDPT